MGQATQSGPDRLPGEQYRPNAAVARGTEPGAHHRRAACPAVPSQVPAQPAAEAATTGFTLPFGLPRWLLGVVLAGLAFAVVASAMRPSPPADPAVSFSDHGSQQTDGSKTPDPLPAVK